MFLLELTRAHDVRPDWAQKVDALKCRRYQRLQEEMQQQLTGWAVETVPLTVGIRGSIQVSTWIQTLDRLGIRATADQQRFLHGLTRQVLEELDRMYGVRSEALRTQPNG